MIIRHSGSQYYTTTNLRFAYGRKLRGIHPFNRQIGTQCLSELTVVQLSIANIMHPAMLTKLFQQTDVPVEFRSNFLHLYLDIAWFGVLSGSAVNFLRLSSLLLHITPYNLFYNE